MKSRILVLLCLACVIAPCFGQDANTAPSPAGKTIAVTFDKLPFMEPLGYWSPREVSNLVLRTLAAENVQAIGFVIEEKVEDRPETLVVLQDWVEKGQLLGNNTYSYLDLNEVEWRDFIEQIADVQRRLRRLTRTAPMPRYFRFPMLHEGNTLPKRTEVMKRLQRNDFVVVPATVLLSDFEFNHVYVRVADDDARSSRLKTAFLELLASSLEYAETQSAAVFDHQIPQILQLHLGIATAAFLPDAFSLLKERGYRFITVDEALSDPAYASEDTYIGPLGLSFIDRIAASRGLPFREDQGVILRRQLSSLVE